MFANAEMQGLVTGGLRLNISAARKWQSSFVRRAKGARASNGPWAVMRDQVQSCAGSVQTRDTFIVGWKCRQVSVPSLRKLPALHHLYFIGEFRITSPIRVKESFPFTP